MERGRMGETTHGDRRHIYTYICISVDIFGYREKRVRGRQQRHWSPCLLSVGGHFKYARLSGGKGPPTLLIFPVMAHEQSNSKIHYSCRKKWHFLVIFVHLFPGGLVFLILEEI